MLRSLTSGPADLTPQLAERVAACCQRCWEAVRSHVDVHPLAFPGGERCVRANAYRHAYANDHRCPRTRAGGPGAHGAGLARILTQQNDFIAGAMPPGLSKLLDASGLHGATTNQASSSPVANFPSAPAMARGSTDTRASAGRWPLWTLAALIGLGALLWYGWDRTPAPAVKVPATPAPVAFLAKTPEGWVAVRDTVYADKDVYNPAGEKIGAIKYILNAPNGNMQAAVIGLARVLGIGEKISACPYQPSNRCHREARIASCSTSARTDCWRYPHSSSEIRRQVPTSCHIARMAQVRSSRPVIQSPQGWRLHPLILGQQ